MPGTNYNAIGKKRQEEALTALDANPAPARLLVKWGYFRSQAKARERLHTWKGRGSVEIGGVAYLENFPELIWTTRHIPGNLVQHEAEVTKIVDLFGRPYVKRTAVPHDGDALVRIEGDTLILERERSRKRPEEMKKRFDSYVGCPFDVLWFIDRPGNLDLYQSYSAQYREAHWFCLYGEFCSDPRGEVFTNHRGEGTRV